MEAGQFVQFLIGSAQSLFPQAKRPGKLQATIEKVIEEAQEDLRITIEKNLPVIYLVDTKVLLQNFVDGFVDALESKKIDKYVYSILVKEEGFDISVFSNDKAFEELFDEKLVQVQLDLTNPTYQRELLTTLDQAFPRKLNEFRFIKRVVRTLKLLQASIPQKLVAASNDQINDISRQRISEDIRRLGTEFRDFLRTETPAKISSPERYISNFKSDRQLVIVVDSYRRAIDLVNSALTEKLRSILKQKFGIEVTKDFTAGSFTQAGHTGLLAKDKKGVVEVVGINTPLTQRIIVAAQQEVPTQTFNLNDFVLDTDHIRSSVEITKPRLGKTLLSMNFSVLISMEKAYNLSLSGQETKAADALIKKFFDKTRKSLFDNWKKTLASSKAIEYIVSRLRFSPTIAEDIAEQIHSALQGKKSKKSPVSTTVNTKTKETPVLAKFKTNIKTSNQKVSVNPGTVSTKKRKAAPTLQRSVTNLQNLLNNLLVTKIKENMGTGSRRDILNLRSGRFAESVKVNNISSSRAGMISVFYSYMKNPYATFSQGGLQQYPRSRDPKLLISRSIRELAAQQMITKLRTVAQ